MTVKPGSFIAALAAVLLAASVGAAYAAAPSVGKDTTAQEKMPPKDCKKKPDDPRCKDKKY